MNLFFVNLSNFIFFLLLQELKAKGGRTGGVGGGNLFLWAVLITSPVFLCSGAPTCECAVERVCVFFHEWVGCLFPGHLAALMVPSPWGSLSSK